MKILLAPNKFKGSLTAQQVPIYGSNPLSIARQKELGLLFVLSILCSPLTLAEAMVKSYEGVKKATYPLVNLFNKLR